MWRESVPWGPKEEARKEGETTLQFLLPDNVCGNLPRRSWSQVGDQVKDWNAPENAFNAKKMAPKLYLESQIQSPRKEDPGVRVFEINSVVSILNLFLHILYLNFGRCLKWRELPEVASLRLSLLGYRRHTGIKKPHIPHKQQFCVFLKQGKPTSWPVKGSCSLDAFKVCSMTLWSGILKFWCVPWHPGVGF